MASDFKEFRYSDERQSRKHHNKKEQQNSLIWPFVGHREINITGHSRDHLATGIEVHAR